MSTIGEGTASVATRPRSMPEGYRSLIVAESDLADAGRDLEYEIFVKESFFAPSETGRITDYAEYEDRSIFHLITDDQDEAVGVVRSVLGEYENLPLGHYVPQHWGNFPSREVCEYASLAIRPDVRKHGLAEELYRSVFSLAWRSGMEGLVALVDPWLQELLNDYYGCAFEQIGPDCHSFNGFVVRPIGVKLKTLERVMPLRVPDFWAWLVEGIEQDDVVVDLRETRIQGPELGLRDAAPAKRESPTARD